jgi:hypothetical protein
MKNDSVFQQIEDVAEYNAIVRPILKEAREDRDEIKKLKGIIKELIEAYDSKNLEMRSPEIGEPENGIPYHEWHEEWLHHARAAVQ